MQSKRTRAGYLRKNMGRLGSICTIRIQQIALHLLFTGGLSHSLPQSNSQRNLDKVTFFIEECRNLGIQVLGPHVNESGVYFEVNKKGEIRFGLGAIKGAGDAAVEAIIHERDAHGAFLDIFDFAKRVNQRSVNKKTFECLALSGAFDCFYGVPA